MEQFEDRARQEEELFTRVPLTKKEKRKHKGLRKSRNGYAMDQHFLPFLGHLGLLIFLFNYPVEHDIFHHMIKLTSHCSRLLGLTDGFNDEIKTLALDDDTNEQTSSISNGGSAMGKLKKRKVQVHHLVLH